MALICADPPTRETLLPTLIAGRKAAVEKVSFEKDLTVSDRDHVRRNVCRDVTGLRLDDGETRQ
jgi:hypothetical protein